MLRAGEAGPWMRRRQEVMTYLSIFLDKINRIGRQADFNGKTGRGS
jgi:hypothetical protein